MSTLGRTWSLTPEARARKSSEWTPERRARQAARLIGNRFGTMTTPAGRARASAALSEYNRGRPISDETKAKISAARKGQKNHLGRPHSEATRQRMRGPKSTVGRAAMSAAAKRRWAGVHPVQLLAAISQRPQWRDECRRNGVLARRVHVEYLDRLGRIWRLRSGWERSLAEYLDREGLTWAYEPHQLLLSNGRVYVPDFYVDEWATYVEVKGWSGWGKAKIEQAIADGHPIRVLTLSEFREMGVPTRG